MNAVQTTPAAPSPEATFSWMFNILTLIVLTSFIARRFWPGYWEVAAVVIVAMILVGACAMLAYWALGKPVSGSAAFLMGLLLSFALIGAVKGSTESKASGAEPAPKVERHRTTAEPTLLGPEKLHLD